VGSGAHVDAGYGQQSRPAVCRPRQDGGGGGDVPAGAAREGEGVGERSTEGLSDQGRYEQAEEIHRQTLRPRETVLGKEHPHMLESIGNLANV
jgi:hypothetical protein